MTAGRPPEGGHPSPDSTQAERQAFEEAWARWRQHLAKCDGKPRPRIAPSHWGRP